MLEAMRAIIGTTSRPWVEGEFGPVAFDAQEGMVARAREEVCKDAIRKGFARWAAPIELASGSHLVRRRSGMGDVLCLTPIVRLLIEEYGAKVRPVSAPGYQEVWNWLSLEQTFEKVPPGLRVAQFDGWLERHPARTTTPAAQCYADWWNLKLEDMRPHLGLTEIELAIGRQSADALRDGDRPLVALFTDAGWANRKYRGWRVAEKDLARGGCTVVGFGPLGNCARRGPKHGVRGLASFLAACDLVLCGDTGPLHLAAAVGTPSIAVFCATSAAGSCGVGYKAHALEPEGLGCWPCWTTPCGAKKAKDEPAPCVSAVEPEAVYATAEKILGERSEVKTG